MTASGAIKFMRPGHRHKRFVKSPKRNAALRSGKILHEVKSCEILLPLALFDVQQQDFNVTSCGHTAQAYAKVMRQLGFRRTAF